MLSYVYVAYGKAPGIAAVFYGLKPAVVAIVAAAVIRIGRRALKNEVMWGIAALAFVAIFFLNAPFPLIIGAPYIETMRTKKELTAALSGITAAAVGVVLNFAVWFGLHVMFPSKNVVDWFAVCVSAVAFMMMLRWKVDIVPIIGLAAVGGFLHSWFTSP